MSPSPAPCPPRGLLFLCVANSARSQLAEGWARTLTPAGTPVYSAGSEPGSLNPHAVTVMREVGIDIADQRSKGLDEWYDLPADADPCNHTFRPITKPSLS